MSRFKNLVAAIEVGEFSIGALLAILFFTAVGCAPASAPQDSTSPDSTSTRSNSALTVNNVTLDDAIQYFKSVPLPDESLPSGFLEIDRLLGECVASFGIPVLEPELAFESGVYYFSAGEQLDTVNSARHVCEQALLHLGILLSYNESAHLQRYEAFIEVKECLERHGYPTTSPPSPETFVENPNSWSPWEGMIGIVEPMLPTPEMRSSALFKEYFDSLEVCPRP